ncbi:MAG: Macrolide-specific efflux protein macA precursor [Verrucomicrobiales bacterium]|nr:Macrolide-specific efflux protein macA precursor [Verrucomicrobiales bacterium]
MKLTLFPKLAAKLPPAVRRPRVWVPGVLLLGGALALTLRTSRPSAGGAAILTAAVQTAPFVEEILESGELESASNVEVRCRVRSMAGAAILTLVTEGSAVKKGNLIMQLDDSDLKNRMVDQQINVNKSAAELAQAQADLSSSEMALREYQSGLFLETEKTYESAAFVAEENLRRANEYLRYSKHLAQKGYISEVQLEADTFALGKATKELELSKTKLDVLRLFTKEKTVKELMANVEKFKTKVATSERSYQIDVRRLEDIKEQIAFCRIAAPLDGQVVYANDQRNRGSSEPLIAEGKVVRENQVLVRLPDPTRMQVLARINESRVDRIRNGQKVRISLDALPGTVLTGKVDSVSDYPMPPNPYYSNLKYYACEIPVVNPPVNIRPGMTSSVSILVEQLKEARQVPLAAVFARDDRHYCLVRHEDEGMEAREITVGASNDAMAVVENGLTDGEQVVLSPQPWLHDVSLPAPRATVRSAPADAPDPGPRKGSQAGSPVASR